MTLRFCLAGITILTQWMTKIYSWIRVNFGFQSTDARIGHVKRMITVLTFLLRSCFLFGVKSALLSISFRNICSSAIHLSLRFTCCDKIIHLDSMVIPWTEWKSSVLNLFLIFPFHAAAIHGTPCLPWTTWWKWLVEVSNFCPLKKSQLCITELHSHGNFKKLSVLMEKTFLADELVMISVFFLTSRNYMKLQLSISLGWALF